MDLQGCRGTSRGAATCRTWRGQSGIPKDINFLLYLLGKHGIFTKILSQEYQPRSR